MRATHTYIDIHIIVASKRGNDRHLAVAKEIARELVDNAMHMDHHMSEQDDKNDCTVVPRALVWQHGERVIVKEKIKP